jgi:formylmethanofuran dehydrogenase subunit C
MRRGIIAVLGDVGDFAGTRMVAGSLLVFGHLGKRAGAGMKRGSIISFGTNEPLLPTYCFEAILQPVYIRILLKFLHEQGLSFDTDFIEGTFKRYSGDINVLGKGEVLLHVKS